MPMYTFCCTACKHSDTEFRSMRDTTTIGGVVICPKCGKTTYKRLTDVPWTDLKEFHKPIEMLSVAASTIEQVRDIQRRCPGVEINDDINSEDFGIPVVANRKQKKAVLKAVGFQENS